MATTVQTSPPTISGSPEQRVILHGVSWETYERLLAEHADRIAPRFTYDRGRLEIVSPSAGHEQRNDALKVIVNAVAMELDIDLTGRGSTTYRRPDVEQGFEPDSSFYIRNEASIRGKDRIDLAVDPPPDLVIEIDIANSSLDKLPVYARFGVPEVWRDDGARIHILRLRPTGDGYDEVEASAALPILTSDVVMRFLAESRTLRPTAWQRSVHEWARAHAASEQSSP
jgi:Uma2 family endonuclease